MSISTINPFAPAALEEKAFLGWSDAITDKELALKTTTLRMFNIGAAVNTMEVTIEKSDDLPVSGAIWDGIGGGWDASATTGLDITADLAGKITNYAVLLVEDELVVVKSVDRGADTIEVYARGYGWTTGAIHADTTVAEITGYNYVVWVKNIEARVIGESTNNYYVAKPTVPSVSFTKEDLVIKRKAYGEAGQLDYVNAQIDKMDKDLLIQMNKWLVYHGGQKATATTPWMFVWVLAEAQTNGIISTSTGVIDLDKLDTGLTPSRNRWGSSNVMVMSAANYDIVMKLANAANITVSVPDRLELILGKSVKAIVTKVGTLIPVLDLSYPDDKLVVCNSADLWYSPLVGFEVPGADRTIAQESTRNDQAFTVDSLAQWVTYYYNSSKNMTIFTGVTQV